MPAVDTFSRFQATVISPLTTAASVTPHNTNELAYVTRALYVGGAGGSSVGGAGGSNGAGSAASANTAGGGGGGGGPSGSSPPSVQAGGAGGSGIVYVRFKTS